MKPIAKRLPSPAMIVACAALLVALGGASYAAGVLPKNSVGTTQLQKKAVTGKKLRNGAVTGAKVANGTLTAADFKAGQLPSGPQGSRGDIGPKGDTGPKGDVGEPGPFSALLPSGKTVRGAYSAFDTAAGNGAVTRGSISFGFALPEAPTIHFIPEGGPEDPACPGNFAEPQAAPGQLCIYEELVTGGASRKTLSMFRSGALVQATSTGAGLFGSIGAWAVTGP
jgi:hypothetical protein